MNEQSTPRVSWEAFAAQFAPHQVPVLLQQFFNMEQRDPGEILAEGFSLACIDKTGIETYSTDPGFAASFIEFAQANYSGSTYAYWLIADSPEQCPIIAFGDEGGVRVVAESLPQLLHLLTYDTEVFIDWEQAFYYRNKNDSEREQSERHDELVQWVKNHLSLYPITTNEEANAITEAAAAKYQHRLDEWLRKHEIKID